MIRVPAVVLRPLSAAAVLFCALASHALAAGAPPSAPGLPDHLTLAEALALANGPHPDLTVARADVQAARAERLAADANMGFNASLDARGVWVDPSPVAPNQSHNDSSASVLLTKRLYDFGHTGALRSAAEAATRGSELQYTDVRNRHRIAVLARYFDVLLADQKFAVTDQAMAVAYVSFDRVRDRHKLKQVSDITLLESQNTYERARTARYAAEAAQRTTRARLADALDRPGSLPSTLETPRLPGIARPLPDVDDLISQAMDENPLILAMHQELRAARERLAAARTSGGPVLSAEAEAADYNREFGSRDRWRGGVILNVPLFTGGSVDAAVGKAQAALERVTGRLGQARLRVRQAVLDAWENLHTLRAKRQEDKVLLDYRDLYLDRARALYQLEVRTDLGDSMVRYTEAQLQHARTRYRMALDWARLAALTGNSKYNPWAAPAGAKAKEDSKQ